MEGREQNSEKWLNKTLNRKNRTYYRTETEENQTETQENRTDLEENKTDLLDKSVEENITLWQRNCSQCLSRRNRLKQKWNDRNKSEIPLQQITCNTSNAETHQAPYTKALRLHRGVQTAQRFCRQPQLERNTPRCLTRHLPSDGSLNSEIKREQLIKLIKNTNLMLIQSVTLQNHGNIAQTAMPLQPNLLQPIECIF